MKFAVAALGITNIVLVLVVSILLFQSHAPTYDRVQRIRVDIQHGGQLHLSLANTISHKDIALTLHAAIQLDDELRKTFSLLDEAARAHQSTLVQ